MSEHEMTDAEWRDMMRVTASDGCESKRTVQIPDHAPVTEELSNLAYEWVNQTLSSRSLVQDTLTQLLADALRDRAVKEAEWWANEMVDYDNPGAEQSTKERIAKLKAGTT